MAQLSKINARTIPLDGNVLNKTSNWHNFAYFSVVSFIAYICLFFREDEIYQIYSGCLS